MSLVRRVVNAGLQGLLALLGRRWRPQASVPVTRIVVIELTRLGDVCAASALFQPLRHAYPQASLEAVVQAPYAPPAGDRAQPGGGHRWIGLGVYESSLGPWPAPSGTRFAGGLRQSGHPP